MNILFIKPFFLGFMVSEIPRVSVFGHCPYSVTSPTTLLRNSLSQEQYLGLTLLSLVSSLLK